MENNIMVSVVCTAYNHEAFIRSALDGFVMQKTNFPFEVLIHDDASTDGTADIIREYAEQYPEIIRPILQTENQYSKKIPITNEIILPKARGKYVAFCEGDDFWTDETKLQKQVDFLEKNPDYVACAHNSVFHFCSGKEEDKLTVVYQEERDMTFQDAISGMEYCYQSSALVVRRACLLPPPDFYEIAVGFGIGDVPRAIWFTIQGKVRFFPWVMSTYRYMSSATAWSAANFNLERIVRYQKGIVEMLEMVKHHVDSERIKLIDQNILKRNFIVLDLEDRFDEMMKMPYLPLWREKPLLFRIKTVVKKQFPGLLKLFRKCKRHGK
jgi:glycosyltransferase involved in cell wall biosynthesis